MKNCMTRQLLQSETSGCLVENPTCSHAHKFGFSIVCCHPDHTKFHAHVNGNLTKDVSFDRYNMLRQKRREEFTASLDENSRKYFNHQTDFFGLPLSSNTPLDQQIRSKPI